MVAMITDKETDTTLLFMKLNNRSQEEIDQYLQDQKDIAELLANEGYKTFKQISERFDHNIASALSYLVHSEKISFSIQDDGEIHYWDWGDY